MKKNSKRTGGVKAGQRTKSRKSEQITIGLDLGDKTSHYCVLAEDGERLCQDKVATNKEVIRERRAGKQRGHRGTSREAGPLPRQRAVFLLQGTQHGWRRLRFRLAREWK